MKKLSPSWIDIEELDRINYIIETINPKNITDDHLNDLLVYITNVIRCAV